ncbi:MAG: Ca2+-binding EF-hand superfamily protein [Paracoccaceae bacterium]|jgi:Ca2+-binding EF-hand superfamily protein
MKSSTKFVAGIVAVAASLAAVGAFAESKAKQHGDGHGMGMHGKEMSFEVLDADGDGMITLEEMQNLGKDRFVEIDTNQDGKLSAAELEAHGQKQVSDRVAMMIERHDKNGDSLLVIEEMPGSVRGERMFEHIDLDGNGSISQKEYDKAHDRKMRHGKGHSKDN